MRWSIASTGWRSAGTGRRVVILEPESEGHVHEWLDYLVRSAVADGAAGAEGVYFVVAPEMCARLAALVPVGARHRVQVVVLHDREARLCTDRRLAVSAFARWWVMRRYLRLSSATSAHFLSIDHLSLPLALGLGFGGAKISGILFRPSVHYGSLGPYRPNVEERARDFRKAVLYRLMLLNPALRRVLTLDPYFAEFAAGRYRQGTKVRALSDPLCPFTALSDADSALARTFPRDRVRFVLFGSLTRRKGIIELLAALLTLDPEQAAGAAVMLAGKVSAEIRPSVATYRNRIVSKQPNLWIHLEDRRLTGGEIDALIAECDVVLAPYQRFVGSSGVLLWAARAAKPVVTQDFGLIGRLVREHRLGLAIDATNPAALAQSMQAMIVDGPARHFDRHKAACFVQDRTPAMFAASVFASMGGS
jgi:glycosyltransferase involved in cell wall biosynthesis